MKFYDLNTEYTFGKFKGKTLKEVISIHETYLNWCAINLEHFYLDDEVISEIKNLNPIFELSDKAKHSLRVKFQDRTTKQNRKNAHYVDDSDLIDWNYI